MKVDIKVPQVGESITEATIGEWKKKNGESVKRDDVLLVLETDKASVEVVAEHAGALSTSAAEGSVVQIGSVIGQIDTAAAGQAAVAPPPISSKPTAPPIAAPTPVAAAPAGASAGLPLTPAVRRVVEEQKLNPANYSGTGKDGRLTKADLMQAPSSNGGSSAPTPIMVRKSVTGEETRREPMSTLRKRIAERLVEAQRTAAILTTFNEVDMSALMQLRGRYKDAFKEKYGTSLGFMGFFVKAVIEGLKAYPKVNGSIEGTDVVYHDYYNIGIAVSTEKGLMVPVIRHAESMSVAEIELEIKHYATKARDGKIGIDDLSGGTFTITNGGVFGSLMSTPILNPPQSGILGMHKIEERPMAINGKVEIRPMMYLALSYDHRLIDGRESVSFLVRVKECLEEPSRILLEI